MSTMNSTREFFDILEAKMDPRLGNDPIKKKSDEDKTPNLISPSSPTLTVASTSSTTSSTSSRPRLFPKSQGSMRSTPFENSRSNSPIPDQYGLGWPGWSSFHLPKFDKKMLKS
jgi:hypothetical protein